MFHMKKSLIYLKMNVQVKQILIHKIGNFFSQWCKRQLGNCLLSSETSLKRIAHINIFSIHRMSFFYMYCLTCLVLTQHKIIYQMIRMKKGKMPKCCWIFVTCRSNWYKHTTPSWNFIKRKWSLQKNRGKERAKNWYAVWKVEDISTACAFIQLKILVSKTLLSLLLRSRKLLSNWPCDDDVIISARCRHSVIRNFILRFALNGTCSRISFIGPS